MQRSASSKLCPTTRRSMFVPRPCTPSAHPRVRIGACASARVHRRVRAHTRACTFPARAGLARTETCKDESDVEGARRHYRAGQPHPSCACACACARACACACTHRRLSSARVCVYRRVPRAQVNKHFTARRDVVYMHMHMHMHMHMTHTHMHMHRSTSISRRGGTRSWPN